MPSLISGYRQRSRISCSLCSRCGTLSRAAVSRRIAIASGSSCLRPVARHVPIIPLAVLLAEAPGRMQRDVRLIIGRIGRIFVGVRAMHVDADVDARHVEDREDAHRHAPGLEHAVDSPRRGALEHHALGLARVAFHHAIADEAVTDAREHGRLLQRFGEIQRGADHRRGGLVGAHHFEQRHHVRGREEVQADDVLGPPRRRRDRADVERRGVRREHGARLSRPRRAT